MKNEIVKINASDYGLEEKQAKEIQSGLTTILSERDILIDAYKDTIELEVTEELIPTFKDLRLQISKNRTQGLKVWHKTNKAYFLAGGNFVQAIYNREVAENERMEYQLLQAEKHFENLKIAEIAKTKAQRALEIAPFLQEMETAPELIGEWEESVYQTYLSGAKAGHRARQEEAKKAELARIEAEKIEKLNADRKYKTSRLINFIDNYEAIEFGKLSDEEFKTICDKAIQARSDKEAKEEKIRLENIELKKQADKAKAKADAEAKERAKKEAESKAKHEAELKAQREKQAKLEAELKAKADAEAKAIKDAEAAKQAELSKGDADKIKDLISDLTALKTKYDFKSDANKALYSKIGAYLDNLIIKINN